MAISRPPMMSTEDVVGAVTALARVPNFQGDSSTISANGADRRKNSHREVVETTFTPAMLSRAQTMTTASPTMMAHYPWLNQGARPTRQATNGVGSMARSKTEATSESHAAWNPKKLPMP